MHFDFDAFHDAELSEYMEEARPAFTSRALCRGTIHSEIDQIKAKAVLKGVDPETLVDFSTTFFPSRGGSSKVAKAKAVCDKCPVQWDCFEYAYTGEEGAGVWGGASLSERDEAKQEGLSARQAFIRLFGESAYRRKR